MVMQKRWFIRKDVDIKEFAKAAKACKDFTPKRQKEMLKLIFILKLDKLMASGAKKKRTRKKIIKNELENHKEHLAFRMLDMMEEKWVDVSLSKEQDWKKSKQSFDALIEIADGKHDKELKEIKHESAE